jgi:hypothetical protein
MRRHRIGFSAIISLVGAVVLLKSVDCVAQSNRDPTFNGLITQETCIVRSVFTCTDDGYCWDSNIVPGATALLVHLDILGHTASIGNTPASPIEVIDISPAGLNQPLWIKFKTQLMREKWKAILTLIPLPNSPGGYFRAFGLVGEPTSQEKQNKTAPGDYRIGTNVTMGGTCER